MNITVVGSGYVGLSLGIILSLKNSVKIVDIIPDKVNMINNRVSPIQDEYIENYFKNKALNLEATLNAREAYKKADLVIIATPTNYDSAINYFDTKSVEGVIKDILSINYRATIVVKSTIPNGFIKSMREKYQTDRIIFSPEFLRESKALYDNLYPSRIIVSCEQTDSLKVKQDAKEFALLLKNAAKKEVPVFIMGVSEAEAVKLFSNTFLALRIAYFNELDTYAESKNLDAEEIIKGISCDSRIGDFYNNPSFGYGGYCLPKDTKQLLSDYKDIPQVLIGSVIKSNKTRKEYIANKIISLANSSRDIKVIGFYRLIMKSYSDNFRESAIKDVITIVKRYNFEIVIYEPLLDIENTNIDLPVESRLDKFKEKSDIIVTNRQDSMLKDVIYKVYTRDIFFKD